MDSGESEITVCTGVGSVDLVCHGCGSVHSNAKTITLPDGRQVGSQSEAYRTWCEAKWAMTLPDKVGPRSTKWTKRRYLLEVQKIRGERAAEQLRALMVRLWKQR